MLKVESIKEKLKDVEKDKELFVCLKPLEQNNLIRFYISRISRSPIGLELIIDRNKGFENIKVGEFMDRLKICEDKDHVGFFYKELEFLIQRGSAIDEVLIKKDYVCLSSILFPRPVI
jgi:hypothetical protein